MLKIIDYIENQCPSFVESPRDHKKLETVRADLRESMVKWMKIISESNKEAMDLMLNELGL